MKVKFDEPNRCESKTEIEARKEVCGTRNEEVHDDVREESEEQRKHEDEEEFGGRKITHNPRQPSEQERIEHEMTHFPCRSWCRHCVRRKGRKEDCRKASEEERDRFLKSILDHMFMCDEREGETLAFFTGNRTSNESGAQHRGPEVVDGRMGIPKADGMAAWSSWTSSS